MRRHGMPMICPMGRRFATLIVAVVSVAASVGAAATAPASASVSLPMTQTDDPVASRFVADQPTRIADTRIGQGSRRVDASTIEVFPGKPGTTPTAAVLTLTVTDVAADGFVTVWPSGGAQPTTSNLNVQKNGTIANTVVVPLGTGGGVKISTSAPMAVIVDRVGWFERVATGQATEGRFVSVDPTRLLDTRHQGIVPAGGSVTLARPSWANDATALAINLTIADAIAPGYVTAWPAGTPRPLASTGNLDRPAQTRALFTLVPVGDGGISIYLQSGGHVIVDIVGWFTGPSSTPSSEGLFLPTAPARRLDTRNDAAPIWPDGTVYLDEPDLAGRTVWANVTATRSRAPGFITAYPGAAPLPNASTLNVGATGATIANATIVSDRNGIAFFASGGTELIVDVQGSFTGAGAQTLLTAGAPQRRPNTRPLEPLPARVAVFTDSLGVEAEPWLRDEVMRLTGSSVALTRTGFPGTSLCDHRDAILAGIRQRSFDALVIEFSGNAMGPCFGFSDAERVLAQYRADAETVANAAANANVPVMWVGTPAPADQVPDTDVRRRVFSEVYRPIASRYRNYLSDAHLSVYSELGAPAVALPCAPGEIGCQNGVVIVRSDDGVHFCPGPAIAFGNPCPTASPGAARYGRAMARSIAAMFGR